MTIKKRLARSNLLMILLPVCITGAMAAGCLGLVWYGVVHGGGLGFEDSEDFLRASGGAAVLVAEALEAASQGLPYTEDTAAACASFMQVSGLKYTVDTAKEYDKGEAYGDNWFKAASLGRVTIDEVNGQPFDAEATYAVITSNANFKGMDSSYIFPAAAEENEKSTITTAVVRDVVWMYISEELGNVIGDDYAEAQGRIVIK